MALKKQTRPIETKMQTPTGELMRNVDTEVLVFELACHCGIAGGEVVFPLNHGRATDEELEAECKRLYTHHCDTHKNS